MEKRVKRTLQQLKIMFPDARCELNYSTPLELVIAVVLSAQCTDIMVNKVTAKLFAHYKTLDDYVNAPLLEVEGLIKQIGLYRNKAKFIKQLTHMIKYEYDGEVPMVREQLVKLPGVGRKTANVVLSVIFGIPAIAVDTHVERVSKRIGICPTNASVLKVEEILMREIPKELWSGTHHRLVLFGRYHCKARKPECGACPLLSDCFYGSNNLS